MKLHKLLRLIPIIAAVAIGAFVAMWPSLKFNYLSVAEFTSRFSVLLFFSLLIERTVEIIMSIWRSEESHKREAAVKRLISNKTAQTNPKFVAAQESMIEYRTETMQMTMPISFALGLIVAALGVRALSQFIDPTVVGSGIGSPLDTQRWWFNMIDIIFTGALLAGGADPIHKLLDLYRKFVESSAAKASGTKS